MAITERYATATGAGAHDGTSEADAWSYTEAVANRAAGQRVNWKDNGSRYSWTPTTDTVAGTATTVSIIRGYTTTIGDGGKCRLDLGSNSWAITGDGTVLQDMDIEGTAANLVNMSSDTGTINRCKIVSTATTGDAIALYSEDTNVHECYIKSTGSASTTCALRIRGGNVVGCTIVTNTTGVLLFNSSRYSMAVKNAIVGVSATGVGIDQQSTTFAYTIAYNSIYGFDQEGMKLAAVPAFNANTPTMPIHDNIIYDCSAGITNAQEGSIELTVWVAYNAIGGVTTRYEFGDLPIYNDIELTENPFNDPENEDLSLNSAAGGGALCRGSGLSPAGA